MLRSLLEVFMRYRVSVYALFILLCVAAWQHLPIEPGDDPRYTIGFVFLCGLIWIYLFNKQCDRAEDRISQPHEMLGHASDRFLHAALPFLALAPLALLFFESLPLWPYLIYMMVGYAYSKPVIGTERLKDFLVIKNIIAGINMLSPLWYGIYVYFPPYYTHAVHYNLKFLAGLFLVYFAGELLWDIRDIAGDKAAGVRTVPVVFGVLKTKYLAAGLVLISVFLMPSIALNFVALATMLIFIALAHPRRPGWFFHLLLVTLSAELLCYLLWS